MPRAAARRDGLPPYGGPPTREPRWADRAAAAYTAGGSIRKIAAELRVSHVDVGRVIHYRGLTRPRILTAAERTASDDATWGERAALAYQHGDPMLAIARELGVAGERVRRVLAGRGLALTNAQAARRSLRMGRHRLGTARPPETLTANTVYTYLYRYGRFARWCEQTGRTALPADPDTYYLYLTAEQDNGLSRGTISGIANAIRWVHRNAGHPEPGSIPRRSYTPPPWETAAGG